MGLFQLLASMIFVFAAIAWMAVVLCFPLLKPKDRLHPKQRLLHLRVWLYAPLWLPLAIITSSLLFSYLQNLLAKADHCFQTLTHHIHHLCGVHPPPAFDSLLAWALPLLLLAVATSVLLRVGFSAYKARVLMRNLIWHSHSSSMGRDTWEVAQGSFMAFTLGFWRSHIFFSTHLVQKMDADLLDVIYAHEEAHRWHRDCFWATWERSFAMLYPSTLRQSLLEALELAREQRSDLWAAAHVGSRLKVAKAITQLARLPFLQPHGSLAVASQKVPQRVQFLLQREPTLGNPLMLPACILAIAFAFSVGPMHHFAELLVNALLHS